MTEQESDTFDELFSKYKGISDRHQSLYIFVVNGVIVEELIEKIKKMIGIIDTISNPSKKSYIKARLNNFVENLGHIEPESSIDGIYFISSSVNYVEFRKYWKETLMSFGCADLLYAYDNIFQLEWLKNLLVDRSYINILHFKNNNLRHYHLNLTKRRLHLDKTEKSMDVNKYIQENTNKNEICIIHGVSSFLKGLVETENLRILSGDKRDEELLDEYHKIVNKKNIKLLKVWMDKLVDPKDGKRLVVGKEIGEGIVNCTLKTIFCSPERKSKLLENFGKDNKIPELIVILQDNDETCKRFYVDFKGGLGITYY